MLFSFCPRGGGSVQRVRLKSAVLLFSYGRTVVGRFGLGGCYKWGLLLIVV